MHRALAILCFLEDKSFTGVAFSIPDPFLFPYPCTVRIAFRKPFLFSGRVPVSQPFRLLPPPGCPRVASCERTRLFRLFLLPHHVVLHSLRAQTFSAEDDIMRLANSTICSSSDEIMAGGAFHVNFQFLLRYPHAPHATQGAPFPLVF